MKKIHYHTDLSYFGGSENMIANFLNSESMNRAYKVSLSFRFSEEYSIGLHERLKSKALLYPLRLPIFRTYKRTGMRKASPLRNFFIYLFYLLEYLPILLINLLLLFRLFRKIEPDVLHINNGGYPGALSCRIAVLAGKLAGIKNIVFVVNNMAMDYSHPFRWPDFLIDRLVARSTSYFITGSSAAMERLMTVLPLFRRQTSVLANGVEIRERTETRAQTLSRFNLDRFGGMIFGVVAAMEPRKGHLYLLRSIKLLLETERKEMKPFIVLIEGTGGVRPQLEKFIQENALDRIVRFIGKEEVIFDFMASIDVLVLPSVEGEDFPNVISEAMALSKPVIATKIAGIVEQVVDGETGILVDALSEVQMADALADSVMNSKKIEVMGGLGYQRYRKFFTSKESITKYEGLYESLLRNSSK